VLKEDIKKVNEEKIPKYIDLLEKYLQKQGGKHFVANRVCQFDGLINHKHIHFS